MSGEAIGAALVEAGALTEADLARAVRLSDADGLRVTLDRLGLAAPDVWARAAAETLGLPRVEAEDFPETPVASGHLSADFLRERQAVPLAETESELVVALVDPTDQFLLQALRLACKKTIRPAIATERDLAAALERLYGGTDADILAEEAGDDDADIERLRDLASEAPVVRLVNDLIARAAELNASDIHIEPSEGALQVRLRIDGVLSAETPPAAELAAAIVSRVKIMAGLDIAERRLPQDGRIRWRAHGRDIDLRVATAPNLRGEAVVMRLLERGGAAPDFEGLGFDPATLAGLGAALSHRHGLFLATGPTGSGKTTTLYAGLNSLNTPERKIITIEDPVEYQLAGISQMQTKAEIGLDFASALRSIVRQAPEVILIGEIRDTETARIAVQSALTGHLVLSTLHTNDAVSAVARLLDMGVEDYLLASTLQAVLAQRLMRRLCPHCKVAVTPTEDEFKEVEKTLGVRVRQPFYRPEGCKACAGRGYRGRVGIYEMMRLDDGARRLITRRADAAELRAHVRAQGVRSLYADALTKVIDGTTSMDEARRVVHDLV